MFRGRKFQVALSLPHHRGFMEIIVQVLDDLDDLWQRLPLVFFPSHIRETLVASFFVICLGVGALGAIA